VSPLSSYSSRMVLQPLITSGVQPAGENFPMPVGPESGGSEAELKNAHPQCLSAGSDGLVFCQVGCTTVIPIQSLSPA
jgi:hypothetical protein